MLDFVTKAEPWLPLPYQKKAVKFLLSQGAGAILFPPGLRKTSITLAALKVLKAKGLMKSALIIAPLRVCYSVWPKEIAKWKDFNSLTCEILHGPKKEEAAARKADIYVINPEGLEWLFAKQRIDVDVLIVDESPMFKNTQTRRFKLIKPQLKRFKRRYILTGTPVSNGYLDLFGQIYLLDQGASLGPYITHYRSSYFFQSGYGGYEWKLIPGADKQIQERIAPLVTRIDAEDHLQLPERIYNTLWVELPPKARKVYKEVEDEFFAELGSGNLLIASTAAVASNKMRQIASGAVYYDIEGGKRGVEVLHDAKLDAVRELVDELCGSPALILYTYAHELDQLRKAFGKDLPYLGGGVSAKRGQALETAWNAGELPILAGQPQSMGHGLNLQESGNTVIWYSLTWDLSLYIQAIDRVYRSGQKASHVFIHHILARDTVDVAVWKAIQSKDKTQTGLLNALKEYGRDRRI